LSSGANRLAPLLPFRNIPSTGRNIAGRFFLAQAVARQPLLAMDTFALGELAFCLPTYSWPVLSKTACQSLGPLGLWPAAS
jgi:hypothetical protein